MVLEELPIQCGARGDSEDRGEAGEPVAAPGALRWQERPPGRSRRGRWGMPQEQGETGGTRGARERGQTWREEGKGSFP